MPVRKFENHNIRKLSKVASGKSFSVTLPVEYIRKLGWKEKQRLVVKISGRHLIVSDWKEKKSKKK